jgi:hypothetical protein
MIPAGKNRISGCLFLALGVIIAASSTSPLRAQTTPWNTNGSSIWYAPSGVNVGIGTASPSEALHIYGDDYHSSIRLENFGTGYGPELILRSTGFGGHTYRLLSGQGFDLGASGMTGKFGITDDIGGGTARFVIDATGNVGIGTTNPQHLLHVAGTIGAEEVLVTSTGADYVFQPGYRLKPLSEVAKYIEANHHLPDIPSTDEVKQKGMGVGEMEAKLLAKIEELTLHMIQQEKDKQDLRQQNQELQERITRLEVQTAR